MVAQTGTGGRLGRGGWGIVRPNRGNPFFPGEQKVDQLVEGLKKCYNEREFLKLSERGHRSRNATWPMSGPRKSGGVHEDLREIEEVSQALSKMGRIRTMIWFGGACGLGADTTELIADG